MNIIGKRKIFYILSFLAILPGIISLVLFGIRPAIDFTGGTLLELKFEQNQKEKSKNQIQEIVEKQEVEVSSISKAGENTYLLRTKPIDKEKNKQIQKELEKEFGAIEQERFETVGPTVGKETTQNAAKSILIASLAIVIYVAWAFRQIPKPYSSVKFGVCAVAALIHDVLLLIGLFSIFGHFFHVEVDGLFITALLTVMGFSVHDSIVVFDRIRENLIKNPAESFEEAVNHSLLQTLARSLSISLTIIFTLFALFLFGGTSIRWFVVALLVGTVSGTYSSIFNAAPLLVTWENWSEKKKRN